MNPVVHFEMPANNMKRMKTFYTKTFGWEMNQMGSDMGHYVVVMTAESDKNGPKKKGIINGGFYERQKKEQQPSFVITVDNLKAHMKKVTSAGGKILGKPWDIPGVGIFVPFQDPEGNVLSMLQPKMKKAQGKKK
jgi:hypothetical protein